MGFGTWRRRRRRRKNRSSKRFLVGCASAPQREISRGMRPTAAPFPDSFRQLPRFF